MSIYRNINIELSILIGLSVSCLDTVVLHEVDSGVKEAPSSSEGIGMGEDSGLPEAKDKESGIRGSRERGRGDASEVVSGGEEAFDGGHVAREDCESAGTCGSCERDDDCDIGVCELEHHRCVRCLKEGEESPGCGGDKPVCETSSQPRNNRCVQCLSHPDCEDKACDPEQKECVECVVEEGASIGCDPKGPKPHCLKGDTASENRCVECAEHGHCPSEACDKEHQVCVECVLEGKKTKGCDDTESTPACKESFEEASENSCVECTSSVEHCRGATPICDGDRCRGCWSHVECDIAGGVCNSSEGSCYGDNEVIYVAGSTCPEEGEGSPDNPFCTIQTAVYELGAELKPIVIRPGSYGDVRLQDGGEVWLVGRSEGEPEGVLSIRIGGLAGESSVYVSGDTRLRIEGVSINNSGGIGIECNGSASYHPEVWLENSVVTEHRYGIDANNCVLSLTGNTVSDNYRGGIVTSDGATTLTGNTVSGNSGGGIVTSGGETILTGNTVSDNTGGGIVTSGGKTTLIGNTVSGNSDGGIEINLSKSITVIVNNIIAENGGSTKYGGVWITSPQGLRFHSNTVVFNYASAGIPAGIRCDDPAKIVNSIVYGNTSSELSDECIPSYCLIEDGSGAGSGSDNLTGDPLVVPEEHYHLDTTEPDVSPCIDQGDPSSPVTDDIDGDPRPIVEGGSVDIGADEAR